MKGWRATSIKEELAERVEKIVEAGIGYRSLSEFINDAIRRRLEEIEPLLEKLPKAPLTSPPAGPMRGGKGGPTWGDEPQLKEAERGEKP